MVGLAVSLGGQRFLSSSAPWKSLTKDKNRLVLVFPDKVQELAVYVASGHEPDGSFEILDKYWKENGIVLYILYRHALLTGDLGWLKEQWPTVRRVVEVIQRLRRESGRDSAALESGLMPPGFPDGGIGGVVPEYTNVYWNLAGLKAAVEAARLIGVPELADWEAEFFRLLGHLPEGSGPRLPTDRRRGADAAYSPEAAGRL